MLMLNSYLFPHHLDLKVRLEKSMKLFQNESLESDRTRSFLSSFPSSFRFRFPFYRPKSQHLYA